MLDPRPCLQSTISFCRRAPCTQRLCFVVCPTPLYCSSLTALLQQMDREGQRDEGRAGWTLSHPAHCPCMGLLVHHPHKHGTTQQSPSCFLPAWSSKILEHFNHLFTKREAQRAQCCELVTLQPLTPSSHPGLVCYTQSRDTMTGHKLLLLQWPKKKAHHVSLSSWQYVFL